MKLKICSRKAAEELIEGIFPKNTAVISFFDPPKKALSDYAPVDYKGKCERLFSVGVHDIDLEVLPDYGLSYNTYLPEANDIAGFIISAVSDGLDIICQCEYGQSRSAACAAAIREYYNRTGIKIFADYRYYPNQLIFNKIYNALKETSKKRKENAQDEDNQA